MNVNPRLGKNLLVPPDCIKTKSSSDVTTDMVDVKPALDECKNSTKTMTEPGWGETLFMYLLNNMN